MISFKGVLAFLSLYASVAVTAEAQEALPEPAPSSLIACNPHSLNGVYVLIYFKETPPGKEARWHGHFSYEYISFYGQTSFYKIMAMNREINDSGKMKDALGPATTYKKYALSPDGVLTLYTNDKIGYSYHCGAIIRDDGNYRKGDVILTGDSKKGGSVIYKLYRHWY